MDNTDKQLTLGGSIVMGIAFLIWLITEILQNLGADITIFG